MMPGFSEQAQRLHADRRARDAIFGEDRTGFGEPGWDMLLALFARDEADPPMNWTATIAASGCDPAVAARYLEWLITRELVARGQNGVALTDRGRRLLSTYFERSISHEEGR